MIFTVLGSGTGIPSPVRGPPGFLLRTPGRAVLVDAGPGTLRAAAAEGVTPGDVDAVVLTHFHPDHVMDLRTLLFCLRNRELYGDRGPLEVVAPRGFAEILDHWWAEPGGEWLRPAEYDFRLREIGPGDHEVEGLRVRAVRVEHTPQSLGYRFAERRGGPVLGLSGDTGPCEGVVEVGRDAAVLVLECSRPDDSPQPGHLTPTQAGEIAARAGPGRLVLTHFYPRVDREPVEMLVAKHFAGPVERAVDGATYEI
jgi:ribonuclease BN (tRNA processing enzyme)